MRKVIKNLSKKAIPAILKDANTLIELEKIASNPVNKTLIKDKIYKGEYKEFDAEKGKEVAKSAVRDALNVYYLEKCAYCEMTCKAEIEHYRPKKGIDEDTTHNGYYWLCYEWTNLVPSCRYCNTEGGKGNQFPIRGNRVFQPFFKGTPKKLNIPKSKAHLSPLIDEKPYLLHPEIDEPSQYFMFSLDNDKKGVKIVGLDTENRGEMTIKICNLNRNYLKLDRQINAIDDFIKFIKAIFSEIASNPSNQHLLLNYLKIGFKTLEENSKDNKLTHTLLRQYFIKDFDNFNKIILPYLEDTNQKLIIGEAFKAYKSGTL